MSHFAMPLGVSLSWFYKWITRTPTPTEQRRTEIDAAVAEAFKAARGLHGSPRLHDDLREAGWTVSEKTVADSMRRQGLVARKIRRRNGLTRQDKTAPKFPDLLKRHFTADRPNAKWVGDMTEIPTAAGNDDLRASGLHDGAPESGARPSARSEWTTVPSGVRCTHRCERSEAPCSSPSISRRLRLRT